MQWISEVMHFCAGLPIILVGCKKDLRREPRVIEELRKTSQRPVTPEEVCNRSFPRLAGPSVILGTLAIAGLVDDLP
jgi:GTPase SAR1 family protein